MPTQQDALVALENLLADYHRLTDTDRASMTEASVARQFIDRLWREVLGWPIDDSQRYFYEYQTEAGRPDMVFMPARGGDIYIEAKRFGVIAELNPQILKPEATTAATGLQAKPEFMYTPDDMQPTTVVTYSQFELQALRYAHSKGAPWAILTNFERMRVFNAHRDTLVLAFEDPSAYRDEFDTLWDALAYDNILNGSLDTLIARRYRMDVDTDYLRKIDAWRLQLADDILQNIEQNAWVKRDDDLNLPLLRAVVQRYLDRLVIVRFAEDHNVIPYDSLLQLYELSRTHSYTFSIHEFITRLFDKFNQSHNSALFAKDDVDKVIIGDDQLYDIIKQLYEARYRAMPADILGNTYEQYLGKTLALDSDGNVITRDNFETRKKQGSYYTPQVIVRYIVDNSLGRYLYATHNGNPDGDPLPDATPRTSDQIRDLRVLDSACGSGSFLIYAFYVLKDFYERERQRLSATLQAKMERMATEGADEMDIQVALAPLRAEQKRIHDPRRLILETHLYGVDLDPQAAEIAVVNLMMRGMEGMKFSTTQDAKRLPLILNQNVKVGNGLIGLRPDDERLPDHADQLAALKRLRQELVGTANTDPRHDQILHEIQTLRDTLYNTFAPDYADHFSDLERVRPFHWGIEFPEAFYDDAGHWRDDGGFTVIFGNPPYGGYLSPEEKNYMRNEYDIGTTNTAPLFMIRADHLLKSRGTHSYIVPKSFTYASDWGKTRLHLLDGMDYLLDAGKVWKDVKLEQVVYMHRKNEMRPYYVNLLRDNDTFTPIGRIDKALCTRFGFYINGVTDQEIEIALKIKETGHFLGEFITNERGAGLQSDIRPEGRLRVIGGRNISPYNLSGSYGYLSPFDDVPEHARVKSNSILAQNIVAHIKRPVDHIKISALVIESEAEQLVILDTVNQINVTSSHSPYFFLGLLMSQLMNWYIYRFIFAKAIRTMHFDNPITNRIPVPEADLENENYQLIVSTTRKLVNLHNQNGDGGDIAHFTEKMNAAVFRLYGLTQEQQKIVTEQMP